MILIPHHVCFGYRFFLSSKPIGFIAASGSPLTRLAYVVKADAAIGGVSPRRRMSQDETTGHVGQTVTLRGPWTLGQGKVMSGPTNSTQAGSKLRTQRGFLVFHDLWFSMILFLGVKYFTTLLRNWAGLVR